MKVGTIFEDSPIGFNKWLPAMFMLSADRNGISSCEVARAIGVTQKTAWFMLHRLRVAMMTATFDRLAGEVEDEQVFRFNERREKDGPRFAKALKGAG